MKKRAFSILCGLVLLTGHSTIPMRRYTTQVAQGSLMFRFFGAFLNLSSTPRKISWFTESLLRLSYPFVSLGSFVYTVKNQGYSVIDFPGSFFENIWSFYQAHKGNPAAEKRHQETVIQIEQEPGASGQEKSALSVAQ